MKKGTVLSLNRLGFFGGVMKNRLLIAVTAVFLIGILAGSLATKQQTRIVSVCEWLARMYFSARTDQALLSVFLRSFLCAAAVMIGFFVCGTSMMGIILSPIAVFFLGFFSGGFCSYFYAVYSLKGIAFNTVILVPSFLAAIVCAVFAACESVKLSYSMARLSLPERPAHNLYPEFRGYCQKYVLYAAICLLSSIADALLSHFFLEIFSF